MPGYRNLWVRMVSKVLFKYFQLKVKLLPLYFFFQGKDMFYFFYSFRAQQMHSRPDWSWTVSRWLSAAKTKPVRVHRWERAHGFADGTLRRKGSCLSLPCGATRVLNPLLQLLTKMADYWTKIKHLPTNLWTGSQTTERTAILRSLFSCLLLWFDWAGEPCLVPPNPQSLDPISHSIWLRRCGWQRQDASIYLLYPLHSSACSVYVLFPFQLFTRRVNSQHVASILWVFVALYPREHS